MIAALENITERVEKKITRFTENINTRVDKIETVQRELSLNINKTASFKEDMKQEVNFMKNVSKQSKEDIKQYQSMTYRRLNVLENKTSDYEGNLNATLNRIQETVRSTRNIIYYYHPRIYTVTKADGSYHAGTNSNKLSILVLGQQLITN